MAIPDSRRRWFGFSLFVVMMVAAFAICGWWIPSQLNWLGYGSTVESPDGNYVADMTTWERFVGGGKAYAAFSLKNLSTQRVVWRKDIELPDGHLDCGSPSRISWADDSACVVFTAMQSDAGRWLQIHVDTNGTVRERWVESTQRPKPDF
jgi:hypothetical protein